MTVLSCDVCGGSLLIDAGGKTATCQYCGAKHSIERMREKVQEIKGTVSIEGNVNVDGIASAKNLLVRAREYEAGGDWAKAEEYFNRVLDLEPANEEAKTGLKYAQENKNPVVGKAYDCIIKQVKAFGCFVEVKPIHKEGFIHISRIVPQPVSRIEDVVSVGDSVRAEFIETDEKGRLHFRMMYRYSNN